MKSFLTSCLFFGLPLLLALAGIAFLADGYTDPYYLRLSSPRQNALIIGSSRAAWCLQPAILNKVLSPEYSQFLYNFGFNIAISPFGEVYFNAIREKLDKDTKHSFFIVSVDPWSIAAGRNDLENPAQFAENNNILATTPLINTSPNFFYLANSYSNPYLTLLTGKVHREIFHFHPDGYLHNDGWFETPGNMDSAVIEDRTQFTLSRFRLRQDTETISNIRVSWLIKTVAFLRQHGDVYLVRVPVASRMLAIENEFCPAFDNMIDSIARQQQAPYFNLTGSPAKYTYFDGSHLSKSSGALVSQELAQLIIRYRHQR